MKQLLDKLDSFSDFLNRDPWPHPALSSNPAFELRPQGCPPQAILHHTVPAVSPAGAGMVALEEQGGLGHVELRQQPAILGTDVQSG